jgi:hypothetical protein
MHAANEWNWANTAQIVIGLNAHSNGVGPRWDGCAAFQFLSITSCDERNWNKIYYTLRPPSADANLRDSGRIQVCRAPRRKITAFEIIYRRSITCRIFVFAAIKGKESRDWEEKRNRLALALGTRSALLKVAQRALPQSEKRTNPENRQLFLAALYNLRQNLFSQPAIVAANASGMLSADLQLQIGMTDTCSKTCTDMHWMRKSIWK